jgi:hypothetical protein
MTAVLDTTEVLRRSGPQRTETSGTTLPLPYSVGLEELTKSRTASQALQELTGPGFPGLGAHPEIRRVRMQKLLEGLPTSQINEIIEAAVAALHSATEPVSHAAVETLEDVEAGLVTWHGTLAEVATEKDSAVEEARGPASGPPAYRAFKELADWLEAREEDLATAIGIGRTTVYSWKRDGREPRRGTAQRIYEYHSVLSSLLQRLGREGLRGWLFSGSPQPRDLLLGGDLASLDSRIHNVLFRRADTGIDLAWAPEPEPEGSGEPADEPIRARPSGRKVKRARVR